MATNSVASSKGTAQLRESYPHPAVTSVALRVCKDRIKGWLTLCKLKPVGKLNP